MTPTAAGRPLGPQENDFFLKTQDVFGDVLVCLFSQCVWSHVASYSFYKVETLNVSCRVSLLNVCLNPPPSLKASGLTATRVDVGGVAVVYLK